MGQENITKTPKKAAIYSTIIPGAGQVYTKKYWKVPVIYAGLITSGYYIYQNHSSYKEYKNAYIIRTDTDPNTIDEFNNRYTDDNLVTLTEFYRRNLEVSTLLFTLTYVLNIIDASVNAHLFEYNINDNVSLKIKPSLLNKDVGGISLAINIKKL
jgi:hypothetical protein